MRQLEAIIRLSESIAKMRLSNEVNRADIEEAHRLFKMSTMNAIKGGVNLGNTSSNSEMIMKIEEAIKRRIDIGTRMSMEKLNEELENRFSNMQAIHLAVNNLVRREEFDTIQEGKVLLRKK